MNEENRKFRLTDRSVTYDDRELFRIEALSDFGDVKAGDLGGFIESEENLSFSEGDDSWVYDRAFVYGNSLVENNSVVKENSTIKNSTITNESHVDHSSLVENSHVGSSYVSSGKVGYSRLLMGSSVSGESVVQNSKLVDGHVQNQSESYGSRIEHSTIKNDSLVNQGTTLNHSDLDGEHVSGKKINMRNQKVVERHKGVPFERTNPFELTTDDIQDLNESEDELGLPF